MIRYRCQSCGASMVSSTLEAGTVEHCPRCGKACVVPNPPPAQPAHRPGPRSLLLTGAVFGAAGLAVGFLVSLLIYGNWHGGASRGDANPSPARAGGLSATTGGPIPEAQARLWAEQKAGLIQEAESAKLAAYRAQQSLASLLADGNFAYLPSALPADPNAFQQLGGIRRVAVVFTSSEGLEAAIGVRDLKPVLETALSEAGFTIDASRPDALILCHVSLIPFQAEADSDSLVYCAVECGVSRQAYIPGTRCTTGAIVWMNSAVGLGGSEDIPLSIDPPKEVVAKAISDLVGALTKAKG